MALDGVSLDVEDGDFVAVMGPSGSGKSTFMNLIGCLDRPTGGSYRLAGKRVETLGADGLAALRNREIGFVFQQFNLLPRTDALGNVELPMIYAGVDRAHAPRQGAWRRSPASGSPIARIIARSSSPAASSSASRSRAPSSTRRACILADEPTGALDSRTALEILALFQELNREGVTLVLVTHDADVARHARRVVRFKDGRVREDKRQQPADAPRRARRARCAARRSRRSA